MHRIAFSRITLILVVAGVMFVGLASCGGGGDDRGRGGNGTIVMPPGNRAPVVVQRFDDLNLRILDIWNAFLDDHFSDPNGDDLTYTHRLDWPSGILPPQVVIAGSTNREELVVTAHGMGSGTITLTARDTGGLTVTESFRVTVTQGGSVQPPPRNRSPVVTARFQDLTHTVSSLEDQRRTWPFNLASYFSDPDGDTLTY